MSSSEKFCLRWNDFESNISVAFRDLREEKDFFDVTLACEDNQVSAHKVILSACSPFFRTLLKRNPHQHPLLYLGGVKYSELVSVLNFMYMGEVNVAQEELNSFLAVAEDLRVKGLTQNNKRTHQQEEQPHQRQTKQDIKSANTTHHTPLVRAREPPERGEHQTQPPKRPRVVSNIVKSQPQQQPTYQPSGFNNAESEIEEILPVKTEPIVMPQQVVQQPDPVDQTSHQYDLALPTGHQEQDYPVEEAGYEYADYGEESYEETSSFEASSSNFTPNDGSKVQGMGDDPGGLIKSMINILKQDHEKYPTYQCSVCQYSSKKKVAVFSHIQANHTDHPGYNCEFCGKACKTLNAFQQHKLKCGQPMDYVTPFYDTQ